MLDSISLKTEKGTSLVNITAQVQASVDKSGVREGVCVVVVPHTTGAVTVNSYLDPKTPADIIHDVDRLVPTRVDFIHQVDGPTDAAGHIKASLIGNSQSFIVSEGKLLLGHSQGVMFFEFDGPRERKVHVRILRDE